MRKSNIVGRLLALATPLILTGGLGASGADCNDNGVEDSLDIASSTSQDCNGNGVPDECDVDAQLFDLAQPLQLSTGTGPISIAAGDLDGDGDTDFAVANNGDEFLSIFLNSGDGSFSAANPVVATSGLNKIIAADLDADLDLDLVGASGSGFWSFLNAGDATFGAPAFIGVAPAKDIAVGDIDSDGHPDIVFTSLTSSIYVRMNNGNGTFSGNVSSAAPAGAGWAGS